MRQMKYRGQRADNDEFIYGSLVFKPNDDHFIFSYEYNKFFLVKPDTIVEYTGRIDVNTREIYEHDVCRIGDMRTDTVLEGVEESYGTVIFERGCFFIEVTKANGYKIKYPLYEISEIEVIG